MKLFATRACDMRVDVTLALEQPREVSWRVFDWGMKEPGGQSPEERFLTTVVLQG